MYNYDFIVFWLCILVVLFLNVLNMLYNRNAWPRTAVIPHHPLTLTHLTHWVFWKKNLSFKIWIVKIFASLIFLKFSIFSPPNLTILAQVYSEKQLVFLNFWTNLVKNPFQTMGNFYCLFKGSNWVYSKNKIMKKTFFLLIASSHL